MSEVLKSIALSILLGLFVLGLFSNTVVALVTVEAEGTPAELTQAISKLGPNSMTNQVYFSDRIVIGTVKELRPSYDFIDVVITVDEWLKNPLPKTEIIVRMGRPNIGPPLANFSVGEKTLFMLKDGDVEKGVFILPYGKHPVSDRDEVESTLIKSASPVATPPINTETSVSTPAAQASPEAPGFEIILGGIGVLAVCRILSERRNKNDRHK
jgi:hypothetical protein